MPRGVHWDDLPSEVRQRIEGARREQRVRETPTIPGQKRWQCCACPEVFTSWAAAERHCDEIGHRRIELVLEVDESPKG